MKAPVVIAVIVVAAALGVLLTPREHGTDQSDPSDQSDRSAPPTTTLTDPAAVFQKAFWKRPTADDRILTAERQEWDDQTGVTQWRWHLTVKPSQALVDHLITSNAFMLARSTKPPDPKILPAGFPAPTAGTETYTNATGRFLLLWNPQENLLHATDSGSGFRPGAPEPTAAPIVASQPAGRVPTTPPPTPQADK